MKRVAPCILLSEGGKYVIGNEFVLISNFFKPMKGGILDIPSEEPGPLGGPRLDIEKHDKILLNYVQRIKDMSLGKEVYIVPSLTSTNGDHIDCDYSIIDSLRVIYTSPNAFHEEYGTKEKLEKIAERHNFDLRLYKNCEEEIGKIDKDAGFDVFFKERAKHTNGINSIINNGTLLTGAIHSEEKEYLESRGLKVIVAPLGDVDIGAGLRCVYGEFNL
ncbi:hypothetical protein COV19_04880 [Candidatus Woesearchaeota archaeon CG10_big_fil_rev_8_21_14_0_10_44_13]|nr:MAG: hypothetical protein COV19_04880 [Candidatus Woesearchaeota archaeon CG10_big_fil_rev_8_21_14_0_10_44_13]